jgi:hypothetical protein
MVSQKKANPSESVNLAGDTQRGLGETGDTTSVLISRYFVARLRTAINVPQNKIMMPAFFGSRRVPTGAIANQKMRVFFCFFGWSL